MTSLFANLKDGAVRLLPAQAKCHFSILKRHDVTLWGKRPTLRVAGERFQSRFKTVEPLAGLLDRAFIGPPQRRVHELSLRARQQPDLNDAWRRQDAATLVFAAAHYHIAAHHVIMGL